MKILEAGSPALAQAVSHLSLFQTLIFRECSLQPRYTALTQENLNQLITLKQEMFQGDGVLY